MSEINYFRASWAGSAYRDEQFIPENRWKRVTGKYLTSLFCQRALDLLMYLNSGNRFVPIACAGKPAFPVQAAPYVASKWGRKHLWGYHLLCCWWYQTYKIDVLADCWSYECFPCRDIMSSIYASADIHMPQSRLNMRTSFLFLLILVHVPSNPHMTSLFCCFRCVLFFVIFGARCRMDVLGVWCMQWSCGAVISPRLTMWSLP